MDRTKHGGRKFYDLGSVASFHDDGVVGETRDVPKRQKLVNYVRENVIGSDMNFMGPFGSRRVLYCDYVASGRSLEFIENYIVQEVLPHYGNTHTTTTVTSLQSTLYRHEARVLVRNAVNAGENDAVVFVGHGCTGAVHKLIHSLNLQEPPIVFVSPYEHHSNLLPWREAGAEIVFIAEDDEGRLDLQDLERKLKAYRSSSGDASKCLIGCLSACSNITGILTDVDAVAACLHRYDALACFDYASAGPYCDINMNPIGQRTEGLAYKDAIFISPHKFVGGPGTPGILVAKKHCFRNPIPSFGGGGSVFYVTANTHRYLQEIEMREEGGTPAIVESIRAGLVFQLKEAIGHDFIMEKELSLTRKLFKHLENCPNILVLGSKAADRLPVLSFLVQHEASQRLLHHNFVCAVMNDLFGIQARGGCACAGPYAQKLLGITQDVALEYERLLLEDQGLDRHHLRRYNEYSEREVLRPGFVRLNLQYFMSDDEVDFVLEVLSIVSRNAWKLLPQYNFNPETGEWRHRTNQVFKDRKWLGSINYENGYMEYSRKKEKKADAPSFKACIEEAEKLFASVSLKPGLPKSGQETLLLGERGEQLRWFLLPSEAGDYLIGKTPTSCKDFVMPFRPGTAVDSVATNGPLPQNQHICSCSAAGNSWWVKALNESEVIGGDQLNADDHNLPSRCSPGGTVRFDTTADTCQNRPSHRPLSYTNGHSASSARPPSSVDHTFTITERCTGYREELTTTYASSHRPSEETIEQIDNNSNCSPKETENLVVHKINGFEPMTSTKVLSKMAVGCPEDGNSRGELTRPPDLSTGPEKKVTSRKTNPLLQFHHPPKNIFGPTVKAIEEFEMIKDGDRVLLCLSGGKDSLSMLHTIRQYQCYARSRNLRFEFGAMTVDPQSSAYNPRPLKEYLQGLQVPYFYEEQGIIQQAASLERCESICSFCSRMKRGRIYACARREGYNVIALGQHLDDLAESFMMSVFHNGLLRTMKANYFVKEGDLRVIRPLVYVREKDLRAFAEKAKLPVIPENCPACFEAPKERHRTKQLLAQQEVLFPNLFSSVLKAIKPLLAKDRTGMESTRDVELGQI